MSPVEWRRLGAACGWRRLLAVAMKLPCSLYCSLWFLLLLGAGSLLLLVHLQDLTEMVQQQTPGANFVVAPRWPIQKDFNTESTALGNVDSRQIEDTRLENSPSDPNVHRPSLAVQQMSNSSPSKPKDEAVSPKQPVTKRHRKLLLKSNFVTSSAPFGEEDQQQQRLALMQESRRRLLREVCAKYQPGVTEQLVSHRQVSRVYVEDRYRLLYCEVPKAGCSNWKRVLMVLGGSATSTRDIPHDAAHYANHLRRLESYDRAGITERLHSYTKVLFVREPFERLVSAFRDKFESPNSYYHPVFGRQIISRYRANATSTALQTGAGVTFREFVQYLLDVRRPVGMDIHWEPVTQLCNPCLLKYNFIGKFESLAEEANFLLQRIGAPSNLTFPDFKDRNPLAERTSSKITQSYFAQLNSTERQKAYDFYYMDYLMFNYPKPFKDLY
ncbi:carbohydrate sulfotransferase 8-like [Myripristis murdjan]|uniref:Carbohydrate sulfotransferase n=1 Tax=Myripristis murdjan TaxID=586833 RepID=A0A667ZUN6_9TELE|nr:carbohydrate sulfotransferase 8-like [Myripristis murdjan]